MLLYVIRHGHPDYTTDTLLPDGVEQAKLVARRLVLSGVDKIYASSMGRAVETAQPTADALGLPVTVVDWARELGRDCYTDFPDGQPKVLASFPKNYFVNPAFRNLSNEEALAGIPGIMDNAGYLDRYRDISEGIDSLLRENGYSRNERGFYDVTEPNTKHIALFCHVGMGRVIASHLLNIPVQLFCNTLACYFTGVTVYYFEDGTRSLSPAPEYMSEHPGFSGAFDMIGETQSRIGKVGYPETGPGLVSYGDIGHLYFDGNEVAYEPSKTNI